ncbi:MAG TPA: hypothetical protein VFZ25_01205 [Chloroflexota bacterium]|nr:hypothetical protein [Chloroflexota bacterium]
MTRIPLPPMAILSQDGALAASAFGDTLNVLDLERASATESQLSHSAGGLAFSPRGTYLAVAGESQLSLLRPVVPGQVVAITPLPAPLFRLAAAEEGLVVGVINFWGERTTLGVWRGEGLRADFSGEGAPLGRFAPFQCLLDGARERVLLAGTRGPGAFSGGGERFIALLTLGAGSVAVAWKGEGLPFAPEGLVYPLAEGRLGVTRGDELVVLALPPEVPAPREVGRVTLAGPEKLVVSPNGAYFAWLNGLGPGAETRVSLARASGEIVDQATFSGLGSFPCLAVNDVGRVAIVSSERPDRVRAFWLSNGRLEERLDVTVAAEETES